MKHEQVQIAQTVRPSDSIGLPYSSSLLLDGHFSDLITHDDAFYCACKSGYESYFEFIEEGKDDWGHSCVEEQFTLQQVLRHVRLWVVDSFRKNQWVPEAFYVPLPWSVGFTLGWLSALSLSNVGLAQQGLAVLDQYADRLLREQQEVAA